MNSAQLVVSALYILREYNHVTGVRGMFWIDRAIDSKLTKRAVPQEY